MSGNVAASVRCKIGVFCREALGRVTSVRLRAGRMGTGASVEIGGRGWCWGGTGSLTGGKLHFVWLVCSLGNKHLN